MAVVNRTVRGTRTFTLLAGLAVALGGCSAELTSTGAPPGPGTSGAAGSGGTTAGASGSGGSGAGTSPGGSAGSAGSSGAAGTGGMIDPDGPTPPAPANPGNVTLRRLNAVEYNNTVRDLLGTELRPADASWADGLGAGFDTVGAALSLTPLAFRNYESAAYALVDDLMADATRLRTIVPCDVVAEGEPCVRSSLTAFARKAFRRPVTTEEIDRLLTPFRTGESLGADRTLSLRYTLAAVLVNQHFLFKLELDPDPNSSAPRRLNDHELATRLSYALWSTMPDDELFAAADAGLLQTDAEFERQVERMLADPKAQALAQHFAGQWLEFRNLESHEVDARAFPTYEPSLATSMKREAERYFSEFLQSGRTVSELLTARFTYVDNALAQHYGLPVQSGMQPGQMWLADTSGVERAGLLTLGAVLTATSFSSRTSPVKRGEFVLKHLLCQSIQSPPADVPPLPEEPDPSQEATTLRQRLERHRENAACLGCHIEMDQIGFGLENYDAIGQYRTTEANGLPVDAAGALEGGSFSGAVELTQVLAADSRFSQCVTQNLMVYALGRYLDQADDPVWIAHIAGTTRDTGGAVGTLLRTLLRSEAFRSRQPIAAR